MMNAYVWIQVLKCNYIISRKGSGTSSCRTWITQTDARTEERTTGGDRKNDCQLRAAARVGTRPLQGPIKVQISALASEARGVSDRIERQHGEHPP
jgi:hypothetical protein